MSSAPLRDFRGIATGAGIVLMLLLGSIPVWGQSIPIKLTVSDDVGGFSQDLFIGIHPSATSGIDGALGEAVLPLPPPAFFDARLIDSDVRTVPLLGMGVNADFRAVLASVSFTETYELYVQRFLGTGQLRLRWDYPLPVGVASARIVSFPDPTLLDVDLSTVPQTFLPAGATKFFIAVTFGSAPLPSRALHLSTDPPGIGSVTPVPNQPFYVDGSPVQISAVVSPSQPCWEFSHWSGDLTSSDPVAVVIMNTEKWVTAHFRKKSYTLAALPPDTLRSTPNGSTTRMLRITAPGGACEGWTVSASAPWLYLSRTTGVGTDSIPVSVVESAIPCRGAHVGSITISSPVASSISVPVVLVVGEPQVTARVLGAPALLGCETSAQDPVIVSLYNSGPGTVLFSTPPTALRAFSLLNPGAFPMTLLPGDTSHLYYSFAPASTLKGKVTEHQVLSSAACGVEVLFSLSGEKSAPSIQLSTDLVNMGDLLLCDQSALPLRTVTVTNPTPYVVDLSYTLPADMELASAPAFLTAFASGDILLRPLRSGADSIHSRLVITGNFGVCEETRSVLFLGRRLQPSFTVEAAGPDPGQPVTAFDTTCVGRYSAPASFVVRNTGSGLLHMTVQSTGPFEVDAFSTTFPLEPGQSRTVTVRFHPLSEGLFSGVLTIASQECSVSRSTSLVGRTLAQRFLASSLQPTQLRLVNCEQQGKIKLTITNMNQDPVIFATLPTLPEGFYWDSGLTTPIVIPANAPVPFSAYIHFYPNPDATGPFGGSVTWFGEPCGTSVSFTLSADRVVPNVTVSTDQVDFGTVTRCSSSSPAVSRRVVVTNLSGGPVTIRARATSPLFDLYSGLSDFPASGVPVNPNASVDIGIQTRGGLTGPFSDSLLVEMVAGAQGECTRRFVVRLSGTRLQPSWVVHLPAEGTDFGSQCLNSDLTRRFVVENTGNAPLDITSDGFPTESQFSLAVTPFRLSVDPGEKKSFDVRFRPIRTVKDSITVLFRSELCGIQTGLTMQGQGIAPTFAVAGPQPASLDLLGCEAPSARRMVLSFSNPGSSQVTILTESVLPDGFVFEPTQPFPLTLDPGMTRPVTLIFTGTTPGTVAGSLLLRSATCGFERTVSFSARVARTGAVLQPNALAVGPLTVCGEGVLLPADRDHLIQTVRIRNTGEAPLLVALGPLADLVRIQDPPSFPAPLGPGQELPLTLVFTPPLGNAPITLNGNLPVVIQRGTECPPETMLLPWRVELTRSSIQVRDTSLIATVGCTQPSASFSVFVQNTGGVPVEIRAEVDGPDRFTVQSADQRFTLDAGQSRAVRVAYAGTVAINEVARLRIRDERCGQEFETTLRVQAEFSTFALVPAPGTPPDRTVSAQPGQIVEVPLHLDRDVLCTKDPVTLGFDIHYPFRQLALLGGTAASGTLTITPLAPGRSRVELGPLPLRKGEALRLRFEVLVGPSRSALWEVKAPTVTPQIAIVDTGFACHGTIQVEPLRGIATLSDLGITGVAPVSPNPLHPTSGGLQVRITVRGDARAELRLVNAAGQLVIHESRTLTGDGEHLVPLPASTLPAGMYLLTCQDGRHTFTQRILVAR